MSGAISMMARLVKREVTIVRLEKDSEGLFGKIIIDNRVFCHTLENQDLAIPPGHYICKFVNSPNLGDDDPDTQDFYEITEVEGRTNILIHVLNWWYESKGCIGLGTKRGVLKNCKAILNSSIAIKAFHKELNKKDFLLNIYDVYEPVAG